MSTGRVSLLAVCIVFAACASTPDEGIPRTPSPPARSTTDVVPPGPADGLVLRDRQHATRAPDAAEGSVALTGRIGGSEFFPRIALAVAGKTPGTRELRIYDFETSCGDKLSVVKNGSRRVVAEVPWHAGASIGAHEAGLSTAVYSRDEDDWKARPVDRGTLRVIEASGGGDTFGRVEIQASDGTDRMSGTIYVIACDTNR